jgi:hypothetical protein
MRSHLSENSLIEARSAFTTVATLFTGFVLGDLASFNWRDWDGLTLSIPLIGQLHLGDVYLLLMGFAAGNTVLCSVLGIILIVVFNRVLNWDTKQLLPRCEALIE